MDLNNLYRAATKRKAIINMGRMAHIETLVTSFSILLVMGISGTENPTLIGSIFLTMGIITFFISLIAFMPIILDGDQKESDDIKQTFLIMPRIPLGELVYGLYYVIRNKKGVIDPNNRSHLELIIDYLEEEVMSRRGTIVVGINRVVETNNLQIEKLNQYLHALQKTVGGSSDQWSLDALHFEECQNLIEQLQNINKDYNASLAQCEIAVKPTLELIKTLRVQLCRQNVIDEITESHKLMKRNQNETEIVYQEVLRLVDFSGEAERALREIAADVWAKSEAIAEVKRRIPGIQIKS